MSLMHDVLHAVIDSQMYGAQFIVPPSTHVPVPLHVSAFVNVPFMHDTAAHSVPAE